MASNITFNGVTYSVPAEGDSGWGPDLSAYFISIASNALQKTGGTFTLTAEVNFGATYGVKSAYLKSQAANPASTGIVRLGNTETIKWRNFANGGDLDLTVNASDALQFNGSSLAISGNIVNADIAAAAAIAYSKLAALTTSRALQTNSSTGFIEVSTVTNTELAKLAGLSGNITTDSNSQTITAKTISGASNTITNVSLTTGVTGTLPLANGGTGQTTKAPAFDALSPMTTSGDIIYGATSGTGTRLAKGTDGQFLTLSSGIPAWAAVSVTNTVAAKTANYTLTGSDYLVTGSASGGAFTLTLPTAVGATGKVYVLKRTDQTLANLITIATTSSQTIDGVTTTTLATQYEQITVISDGSNWQTVARNYDAKPVSFTPTGAWSTNTTYTGFWQRIGCEMKIDVRVATSGAPTSASLTINLPSGAVIDTARMTTTADGLYLFSSNGIIGDSGANNDAVFATYKTTTSYQAVYDAGTGLRPSITQAVPITFGSGDFVQILIRVPIVGWN